VIPREQRRCARKAHFHTEQAARRQRRKMLRSAVDIFRLEVYKCEEGCTGYHIGNRPLPRGFRRLGEGGDKDGEAE
jgi:hypothetical protein